MQQSPFYLGLAKIIGHQVRRVCCAAILGMAIQAGASEVSAVSFGSPGDWVKPHFSNQSVTGPVESGVDQRWLLLENQINVPQNETFVHSIRQVLTTAGVQNGATLTINYNPSCQTLTWHWARIWRGGEHLDRLNTNEIKVVQREQDLEQSILDDEKSAILVLEDVRVGDVIDCAYSIKGANPVFGGHFSCAVPVQLDQPADRLLTRVLWPSKKALYAQTHGCAVVPEMVAGKETTEYVWDARQMPGFPLEDALPAWCDPEPWVQLTDFKTWADVSQWALALFQTTSPLSPELSRRVDEWKQIPGQEGQILAVLRFVQDEVRYFGIEIGAGTEKPSDPSLVFSRRFGDCKDKSLLFVTILRALGIQAYPALVSATDQRAIGGWRPSAGAFDHCIAVVQCNGGFYWLDPTMNYQRGPLVAHFLPNYGYGLVISPRTTGLSAIPQTTGLPRTTTTEYFRLQGKTQPAELKVVTVAEGRDADRLREVFATTKRSDIEKSYTHYYSDIYPGIKLSAPIAIVDDTQQDRVQTTETYTIEKAWTLSEKDGSYSCEFYPATIAAFLKKPVATDRKLPLGVPFPQHQILRTEVTLPSPWPYETSGKNISDPAFNFRKSYQCAGNKLVVEYEYQSLADAVSPEQARQYLQHLDECSQSLGNTLIWR